MNEEGDSTRESRMLSRHPDIRENIEALPEFVGWRDDMPAVEVDGEKLYVVGGDQLKDPDQVLIEWVKQFRPDLLGRLNDEEATDE